MLGLTCLFLLGPSHCVHLVGSFPYSTKWRSFYQSLPDHLRKFNDLPFWIRLSLTGLTDQTLYPTSMLRWSETFTVRISFIKSVIKIWCLNMVSTVSNCGWLVDLIMLWFRCRMQLSLQTSWTFFLLDQWWWLVFLVIVLFDIPIGVQKCRKMSIPSHDPMGHSMGCPYV